MYSKLSPQFIQIQRNLQQHTRKPLYEIILAIIQQYISSIVDSNGGAESDINDRVKLALMKWKQLTGVLCEKQVPIKLKDNVSKTLIRPTMTYAAGCSAVRREDENRLNVAERRMPRQIRGITRKYHVRNQVIHDDAKVCKMSTFQRQKRLNCYVHIKRREEDTLSLLKKIIGHGCIREEEKRRPRRKWIDNTREDMKQY